MMERDWKAQCCSLLDIENPRGVEPFNLVTPRSHCPKCRHKLGAIENIPVISYLLLRGRCKKCQNNIPIYYPLVELLSAISAVIVAYHFGISIQALLAIFLTWALIVLAMIDFQTQLLPDDITLPFLWFGILANFFIVLKICIQAFWGRSLAMVHSGPFILSSSLLLERKGWGMAILNYSRC